MMRGGVGTMRGVGGHSPKTKMKLDKNSFKTAKRVLKYITDNYKIKFIIVLIFIILSSLGGVASALFLETLIDDFILPLIGEPNPSFAPLINILLIMSLVFLIAVISTFLFNRIMVTVSQGVQKTIRDALFIHIQKLPVKYFDETPHGDLMSRFSNDVDALRNLLGQSIPIVFATLLSMTLTLIAMLYMSFTLTIVVLLMVALNLLITANIGKRSAKYFGLQQVAVGDVNAHVEEMIGNQKVVKVFNYEEKSKQDFDVLNEKFCEASSKANTYANMFLPIMLNMGSLQYVVIAIMGGFLLTQGFGGITIGIIASFLQLSRAFSMPLGHLSMQMNSIILALAGASRIFEIMDEKVEEDSGYITLEKLENKDNNDMWVWKNGEKHIPLKGNVVLENVSFGYTKKVVLNGINLYAKDAEKVAIVGATGAGKTTITNLINRFYDIDRGRILYDGIDITKISKPHLRSSLGIVLQDTNLFTDTIKENIRYGRLSATDEEVYQAARLANAHNFIKLLPNGYDTVLNYAGGELSQGQRQLISIARAAVANPPVMILDEATSSIDTRTEQIVQKGMDALMKDRTVFVIAHRLSTVKNSNVIVVMDLGNIIEKGSHKNLIQQKGKYYEMYTGTGLIGDLSIS